MLHLEGAAVLAVTIGAYVLLHGNGWLFLALLLIPDLSMLGYLSSVRVGAAVYNAAHTEAGPLLLGYGLKYETAFRDTHLQRV